MAKEQWVNLPKSSKFTESGITKDRLGPLSMTLEFKKTLPWGMWKLKVTPVGGKNIEYSRKEKGRNKHFKMRKTTAFGVSSAKEVIVNENIYLPAAGGNKFKIEAKDMTGKTIGSAVEVETRRKLYYQVICMKGVTALSTADMEKEYWSPSKGYYLKLHDPQPKGEMKYYSNIKSSNWSGLRGREDMFKQCKKAYKLKNLHPFTFVIACAKRIGRPKDATFKFPLTLYGRFWQNKDAELEVKIPNKYLWFGVDDIDDKKNGGKGTWLNGHVRFDYGQVAAVWIDQAEVTLGAKTGDWYTKVKIKVKKDLRHIVKTRKGKLILSVKVVAGFSGGYSDPMANFICIGSSGWDTAYSAKKKEQILIHEVGHKVGMVAAGTGRGPDAPPNLYGHIRSGANANNKGHAGPHCEKGVNYNATQKKWSGRPGCVMFGATSCDNHSAPKAFCSDCQKAVRKLDVDARVLSNFTKFVTDY